MAAFYFLFIDSFVFIRVWFVAQSGAFYEVKWRRLLSEMISIVVSIGTFYFVR